jgi:hypothetical protein
MAGTSERAGYTTLDFAPRDANGPSATAVLSGVTDPPIKGGGCPEQTAGPGRLGINGER